MGMFDSVYFEGTEGFPETMYPDVVKGEWQTKDLYNDLSQLEFKAGQLYYVDLNSARHELPYTGVFEVHNYDQAEDIMYSLYVSVKEGKLLKLGKEVEGVYPALMPTIQAMEDDSRRTVEGMANTLKWLTKLEDERSLFQKLQINVRAARREWSRAFGYLVSGFKRLLGMRTW